MSKMLIAGLMLFGLVVAQAQVGGMGAHSRQIAKPAGQMASQAVAGNQADPAKAFDALLSSYEREMTGAAGAMPAEKYNFAPSAAIFVAGQGAKFDTVSTFAQQVKHAAEANYEIFGEVGGMKPDVDMKLLGDLKSKDEITSALAASFVFAHKAVATLTPANAFEVVKGRELRTRCTLAALAISHGNDHYGQLVEYLRMNGIIPPASRK